METNNHDHSKVVSDEDGNWEQSQSGKGESEKRGPETTKWEPHLGTRMVKITCANFLKKYLETSFQPVAIWPPLLEINGTSVTC